MLLTPTSELLRRISSAASIRSYKARRGSSNLQADASMVEANNTGSPQAATYFDDQQPDAMELDDLDVPPTQPNIWDTILENRQNARNNLARSHSTSDHSSDTSSSNPSQDHLGDLDGTDSDSMETISDHYFGVDASARGLDAQTLLQAEELIDLAVDGKLDVLFMRLVLTALKRLKLWMRMM